MLASYHGHAPLVRLLLQHRADPNTLNDRGQSPLAGAVFKGEKEVVEVCDPFLVILCKE
jgi:ankyrin repeat protein